VDFGKIGFVSTKNIFFWTLDAGIPVGIKMEYKKEKRVD
jgi:hypothetical protein